MRNLIFIFLLFLSSFAFAQGVTLDAEGGRSFSLIYNDGKTKTIVNTTLGSTFIVKNVVTVDVTGKVLWAKQVREDLGDKETAQRVYHYLHKTQVGYTPNTK